MRRMVKLSGGAGVAHACPPCRSRPSAKDAGETQDDPHGQSDPASGYFQAVKQSDVSWVVANVGRGQERGHERWRRTSESRREATQESSELAPPQKRREGDSAIQTRLPRIKQSPAHKSGSGRQATRRGSGNDPALTKPGSAGRAHGPLRRQKSKSESTRRRHSLPRTRLPPTKGSPGEKNATGGLSAASHQKWVVQRTKWQKISYKQDLNLRPQRGVDDAV